MKLDNINKTMVLIREKELLINRYETSITEIESFKNKIQKEVDDLSTENQSTSVQADFRNESC